MRLLLIIMLVSIFFGCKSGENKQVAKKDTVVNSFRMYRIADTVQPVKRYFFVSYSTIDKNDNHEISGDLFFSHTGMFSKNELDSMCYEGFDHVKSCYQNIVIVSMFEFKNKADFDIFYDGHKNDELPKHKITCK
jgi:hypothetical protein